MSHEQDLSSGKWIKSSHSDSSGGDCLEFTRARTATGLVPVRDSKNPTGPVLTFPPFGWTSFITALKTRRLPAG